MNPQTSSSGRTVNNVAPTDDDVLLTAQRERRQQLHRRRRRLVSESSSSSALGTTSSDESCADLGDSLSSTTCSSSSASNASYLSDGELVQLELYDRRCKLVELAYDRYTSMVKYMCSVMLSQLTTMQKVVSMVAPSIDELDLTTGFDSLLDEGSEESDESDEENRSDANAPESSTVQSATT